MFFGLLTVANAYSQYPSGIRPLFSKSSFKPECIVFLLNLSDCLF